MKYSIIVPVYNCIEFLPVCVDSIQRQSESDWELLLIDDGSTDGSGALCDRLAAQDNRIRVFHKTNGGASSARNLGLEHAEGEHVLFFDGDDTVESDLLTQGSAALGETSPQMVIFGMAFDSYKAAGQLEKTELFSVSRAGLVTREEILAAFSDFFADNALSSACNKAFSGAVLRKTGLRFSEEMTLYEDLDFVLRYLPYCDQIACLDRALYHYRILADKPHINRRVLQLDSLERNLELLVGSMLALRSPAVSQRAADLCAQLFDMHLMAASHPRKDLPQVIRSIRESAAIQALSQIEISPSPSSSPSWSMISSGAAAELYASLRKRKLVSKGKAIVKPVLKKLGLYH
ncbi:MAG: glycosyltransferase family 2 protein [Oscillospiraceae bacterium]|nr:glycosyltransferase family 2 protein [Oscillospiraceae bacterium]MBR3474579.1 glycosyltransferase family 2 protein [Oscillospiraceae bacterium]